MIITLGIPIAGDLPGDALESHLRLVLRLGREAERDGHRIFVCCVQNTYPHDRARVEVFNEARKHESDFVFFVDADTLIPRDAFAELLRVQQQSHAVIVTGHYYRRGWPFTCVWSKKIEGAFFQADALEGLCEIDTCGLGCALVDLRWVVKHLTPPFFTMEMDKNSSIVADDISFCTKIREAGGLILGHAGIRCIHLGNRQAVCDQTIRSLREQYLAQNKESSS